MNILLAYPKFIIYTAVIICMYIQIGLFNLINKKNTYYDIIHVISNFCISFGIVTFIFANFCIIYGTYLKNNNI
jgi:hypothetical protein